MLDRLMLSKEGNSGNDATISRLKGQLLRGKGVFHLVSVHTHTPNARTHRCSDELFILGCFFFWFLTL